MVDKYETCLGCEDREVGCHATCKGYQHRFRRQLNTYAEKLKHNDYIEYSISRSAKTCKNKRKY